MDVLLVFAMIGGMVWASIRFGLAVLAVVLPVGGLRPPGGRILRAVGLGKLGDVGGVAVSQEVFHQRLQETYRHDRRERMTQGSFLLPEQSYREYAFQNPRRLRRKAVVPRIRAPTKENRAKYAVKNTT